MKIQKKNKVGNKGLTLVLVVLIGFFLITVFYIINHASPKNSGNRGTYATNDIMGETEITPSIQETAHLCVIKSVDTIFESILLYDITTDSTIELSYTGATDIRDKYDQVISVSQLIEGNLVDAVYNEANQTLQSLKNSSSTWEYTGVTDLITDRANKWIKMYDEKYKYTSKLYVRDKDGEITMLSINKDDVLTVRGHEKIIDSIVVTRGHGSLSFINAEYFDGATVSISEKDYYDVSSDMVFTVREGTTELVVQKDTTKVNLKVDIKRNKETLVDLAGYTPNPEQKGEVTFSISPFGAELFIDDASVEYLDPMELTYGEHTIEVCADGYESYLGTYKLDKAADTVQISLSKTDEDAQEEDKSSTQNESQQQNGSNSTGSGQSSSGNNGSSGTTESNNSTESNSTNGTNNNSSQNNSSSNSNSSSGSNSGTEGSSEDKNQENGEASNEIEKGYYIQIKAPAGASVYINGVYKGIAPLKIDKPIGITYITLLKEGYQQITHTVNIEGDKKDKTYSFPGLELEKKAEE